MPSPGLSSFVGSWLNVRDFGALGDGNADDSVAIQTAMNTAGLSGVGGTVVIPAGTYRLASSLSWTGLSNTLLWLTAGSTFTGAGTVTAASGTNNSIFDQRASSGSTGVQSITAGNGITVEGTTTPTISASVAAGTGIGIAGTTTLTVSNTGVTSIVAGTGISVSSATGAVTVNATASGGGGYTKPFLLMGA
jgi:polygalacturonase